MDVTTYASGEVELGHSFTIPREYVRTVTWLKR